MLKRPKPKISKRDHIRLGQRFEGTVRDLSSDGQGIVAHPDGRIFFVAGVWRSEHGLFEVTGLKGRMGFAKLVSLSEGSPERRPPPCPYHGFTNDTCGGCPWLFMAYSQQLESKQQLVTKTLQPLNESLVIADIWSSPEELGYRNRAQLKTDGRRLGYVAANSREIAEVSDCLVLNERNRQTLKDLRAQLPNPAWKPSRGKQWLALDFDDDITAQEVVANQRRAFRQGNTAQNQRMREWLKERIRFLDPQDPVLELFAGSGNFTEVLVNAGYQDICAVDSFRPAVETLTSRDLPGVGGLCSDLGRSGSAEQLAPQLSKAKLLLMDPPREGLKNFAEYLLFAKGLHTIIYVSCDPATLSRDLKVAMEQGFALKEAQPLDLFPQTPHVEVLTVLSR
ncbi:class I SAM-dependent RNA methyltransferase [Congregibacter brevis]|uniref:Class I SAM-dependent RNA methyltransferase n=1 Tax=Congregibacter brevis TaxID=3081201 RepID=A0ABZ0IE19_9GAMM|nr:class I SAM-dependent RNA methyltransferase [Congregibacter sp. IMCC45268]